MKVTDITSQATLVVKNLPDNSEDLRDMGSISGSGRSPGGHGNPFQYSYLENPMDRGAQWATVHGVTRVGHDLVTKPNQARISKNSNFLVLNFKKLMFYKFLNLYFL